ncbi:MAG: ThiF family adenylyltransferase, partial [Rikenellaceae bacterium]|nr:ThiF family adenylyltransferase [Rikenellaceae bacterium]
NVKNILSGYDLAVDCTDNFEVRAVLDSACAEAEKAMVYGTAQNWGGQVATFNWGRAGRYVDMFGQGEQLNTVGVISPVVGVIGSLQAVEVIRILTSVGDTLDGKLMVFNCLDNKFNVYTL